MAELNQFYQLVAIADTGTLSKAAEIVHISQPALTRSIQKLEAEWNVTLFDRQKNKITLNKTGKLAVQYARRILDDVNTMTGAIQAYERSLRTISIGACAPGIAPGTDRAFSWNGSELRNSSPGTFTPRIRKRHLPDHHY